MQRKWFVVSITGLIAALTASTAAIAISNKAPIKSKTTLTYALQAVAG